MLEFITEHIPCLITFLSDPAKLGIALFSLALAGIAFYALRRRNTFSAKRRAALIYAHLAALIFPAFFFVFTMACQNGILECHGSMAILYAIAYALPLTLIIALLMATVLFPLLYIFSSKSQRIKEGPVYDALREASGKLGMKTPRLYVVDSSNPAAFSFKGLFPSVFISVRMFELLSSKELEAVLLHEAAHIREGSSLFKFSTLLSRLSPMAALKSFDRELSEEEAKTDSLAAQAQGTRRYLLSAKRKLDSFSHKA